MPKRSTCQMCLSMGMQEQHHLQRLRNKRLLVTGQLLPMVLQESHQFWMNKATRRTARPFHRRGMKSCRSPTAPALHLQPTVGAAGMRSRGAAAVTRSTGAAAATRRGGLRMAGGTKTIAKLRLEQGAEARADAGMTGIGARAAVAGNVMAETVAIGAGAVTMARSVTMKTVAEGARPADAEVLPDAGQGALQSSVGEAGAGGEALVAAEAETEAETAETEAEMEVEMAEIVIEMAEIEMAEIETAGIVVDEMFGIVVAEMFEIRAEMVAVMHHREEMTAEMTAEMTGGMTAEWSAETIGGMTDGMTDGMIDGMTVGMTAAMIAEGVAEQMTEEVSISVQTTDEAHFSAVASRKK
mmetsp:Transcript_116916/g.225522  ORF Transcript_116916/g.225522 Transcript_116916/m.225522 type:complete len:355 (+) Transcript_116916:256-1320(+)